MLDRRRFLATATATAAMAMPNVARAGKPLVLWGPPATPSLLLLRAAMDAAPKLSLPVEVRIWRSPDDMRAGLSSGTMKAVVVPSYVAANLHNRGLGLRLVNILTQGLLYVVAPQGSVATLADLKGKRVALPFKNDMPDFLFRRLLAAAEIAPAEMTVDYSGTPPEAVQLLLAGRVEAALLSEPAAAGAVLLSGLRGRPLERAIDTRAAWRAAVGAASLPQAGLVITDALAAQIGSEGIATMQTALEAALAAVMAEPSATAEEAAILFQLPGPVLARAVPFSHLAAQPASAARADLEILFRELAREDMRIIGGKLPGDRFYAL